ncbi:MAG: FtsL-like putative cell division protein [Bacteroidales bacterium]|jgi:hypothetical protein
MGSNSYKESDVVEQPEVVKEEPPKKKKKRKQNPILKGLQSVMDGTILTKDTAIKSLPFVFFLAFIAILYIANSYYAEKKIIQIEKIKKELKELRSESIENKSKLMLCSRQSEVFKRIAPFGLKESVVPPHKIIAINDTSKKVMNKN